jgi:hypothetical protein
MSSRGLLADNGTEIVPTFDSVQTELQVAPYQDIRLMSLGFSMTIAALAWVAFVVLSFAVQCNRARRTFSRLAATMTLAGRA